MTHTHTAIARSSIALDRSIAADPSSSAARRVVRDMCVVRRTCAWSKTARVAHAETVIVGASIEAPPRACRVCVCVCVCVCQSVCVCVCVSEHVCVAWRGGAHTHARTHARTHTRTHPPHVFTISPGVERRVAHITTPPPRVTAPSPGRTPRRCPAWGRGTRSASATRSRRASVPSVAGGRAVVTRFLSDGPEREKRRERKSGASAAPASQVRRRARERVFERMIARSSTTSQSGSLAPRSAKRVM